MRVKIDIAEKKPFWLQVEPFYTFRTVKRKLQYLHDIPEPQQIISHNSRVMCENSILSESNIQNEDTLKIKLETNRLIILCQESSRWNWLYNVKFSDSIEEVKERISKQRGLPVEMQRLIFNGLELENKKQLDNYNIKSGDTIVWKVDYGTIIEELKSVCSILEKMSI